MKEWKRSDQKELIKNTFRIDAAKQIAEMLADVMQTDFMSRKKTQKKCIFYEAFEKLLRSSLCEPPQSTQTSREKKITSYTSTEEKPSKTIFEGF